jgi:ABC-type metal ion transport system substrate-binding protein
MHCVDDVARVCPNHAHLNSWQLITLEPRSNTNLLVEVEDNDSNWEATSVDNNQLAFELQVGDNFVVRANFVNEEKLLFWVFKCVKMLVHV